MRKENSYNMIQKFIRKQQLHYLSLEVTSKKNASDTYLLCSIEYHYLPVLASQNLVNIFVISHIL